MITGSSGFIGHNLVECLSGIDRITKITGVDIKPFPWEKIEEVGVLPAFMSCSCDVLENEVFWDLCEHREPDVLIHLAAIPRVSAGEKHPVKTILQNVGGCQSIVEAVKRTPSLKRVIFASSSSVYGNLSHYPASEDDDLIPASTYGLSKKFGEDLFRHHHINGDIPELISFRLFNVVGPGLADDLAPAIFLRALRALRSVSLYNGGKYERDYTHIKDVCRAFELAIFADEKHMKGEAINIGAGFPVSMLDIFEYMCSVLDASPDLGVSSGARDFDVLKTWADNELADWVLGWSPELDWKTGINDFIKSACRDQ